MDFNTEDQPESAQGTEAVSEDKTGTPASGLEPDGKPTFEEAAYREADVAEPVKEADSSEIEGTEPDREAHGTETDGIEAEREADGTEADETEPGAEIIRDAGHFPRTKKYLVFWFCYFAAVLVFLITQYRQVVGTDLNDRKYGNLIFILLAAAVAVTAGLAMFVMQPRKLRGKNGKELKQRIRPWDFAIILAADICAFLLIEYVNNDIFDQMEFRYMALNVLGIFIMNMILLFWLNSVRRSLMAVTAIWGSMSIAFYFVYLFRGEPLQLIDFFSITTAATVAGSYTFTLTRAIVVDIVVSACLMAVWLNLRCHVIAKKLWGKLLMRAGVAVFMFGMYFFYLNVNWNGGLGILTDLFAPMKTYQEYGTTVGFFCVAKYMRLTPPDGYSVSETKKIAEDACEEESPNTTTDTKPVNIICIMNESWADYRMVGDLETNQPVMPYYDSLEDNTIKGHTLVCIRGGGTAKTEYEFLTGNSVKRFPGMVPYVSYFTHDEYGLAKTLSAQGYETAAMHPYKGSNWNRYTAYRLLGFDHYYTEDDYDADTEKVRGLITDRANYEKIIDLVNSKEDPTQPYFLFDVTMQNHGGYTSADYTGDITVDGYTDDSVNRYLSLEHLSDQALEELIEYFKNYDQPTIICMFGDHYPALPDSFTEYISGSSYDDLPLQDQMWYYATPFFIWANYDIPEKENVLTSTNFLSTMLLENTGLQMTDYNYYLKDLQETIPALNHMGFVNADGVYTAWKDGDTKSLQNEWEYECLQYNNLGPKGRRIDWFFALTEDSGKSRKTSGG